MGRKELRMKLKKAGISYKYRKSVYNEFQKQRQFEEWKKIHTFTDMPKTASGEYVKQLMEKGETPNAE